MEQAQACDHAHDLLAAIDLYESILVKEPTHHQAREALARLLIEVSDYTRAAMVCEAGVNLAPTAGVLAALSQIHQAYFQVREAIRYAQQAIELDIGCGHSWYALVTALGLGGDEQAADDAIVDGLMVCTAHPELLAEAATRPTVRPRAQVQRLLELTEQFPENRACRLALAIAYATVGEHLLAKENRELVLSQNPQSHSSQAICGMYAMLSSQWTLAQEYVDQARSLWPDSFYALFTQFRLHMHFAQLGEAREVLDHASDLSQGTSLHATFISQMVELLDGPEPAYELLVGYLQEWPMAVGLRAALGDLLRNVGEIEAALVCVQGGRQVSPERYDLLQAEARLLFDLGRTEPAETLANQLEESAEKDLLLVRIEAGRLTDSNAIEALYKAHLGRYPRLDFAWGLLFRNAVETGRAEELETLLAPPFHVPAMVGHCARAYVMTLADDNAGAIIEIEALLAAEQAAVHWIWAWEFALEAVASPDLSAYRTQVMAAASTDGYLPPEGSP